MRRCETIADYVEYSYRIASDESVNHKKRSTKTVKLALDRRNALKVLTYYNTDLDRSDGGIHRVVYPLDAGDYETDIPWCPEFRDHIEEAIRKDLDDSNLQLKVGRFFSDPEDMWDEMNFRIDLGSSFDCATVSYHAERLRDRTEAKAFLFSTDPGCTSPKPVYFDRIPDSPRLEDEIYVQIEQIPTMQVDNYGYFLRECFARILHRNEEKPSRGICYTATLA